MSVEGDPSHESDPYADGTAEHYWHLSRPSPEIDAALEDGWRHAIFRQKRSAVRKLPMQRT